MSPSLDSELCQHARALRGLACALVGSIEILAGQSPVVELRLPADWDR
jgi:hypothetical protein